MKSLIKSMITFGMLVLAKDSDKKCNKKNTNPKVVEEIDEEDVQTQNGTTTDTRRTETVVENSSPKMLGLVVGSIMLIAGLTM